MILFDKCKKIWKGGMIKNSDMKRFKAVMAVATGAQVEALLVGI